MAKIVARIVFLSLWLVAFGNPVQAQTAASKCQSLKVKALGKYVACRTKAEAKAAAKEIPVDAAAIAKCSEKVVKSWDKADSKAAGDIQAGVSRLYQDNGDGTVTDLNTGLMWGRNPMTAGCTTKTTSTFRVRTVTRRTRRSGTGRTI